MKKRHWFSLKIIITLLIILILTSTISTSQVNDDYISSPENIPQFDFIKLYEIDPGETGEVSISIENRYSFDMENISLTISIYKFVTSNYTEEIDDIPNAPTLTSSPGGDMNSVLDDQSIQFHWIILKNNASLPVNFKILTSTKTPEGTYFIRMNLIFEYRSEIYIMKSRGHFTQEEWDHAELTASPTDPGEINLTALGVDGIIPDTSFQVDDNYDESSIEMIILNTLFIICWYLSPAIIVFIIVFYIIHRYLKKARRG